MEAHTMGVPQKDLRRLPRRVQLLASLLCMFGLVLTTLTLSLTSHTPKAHADASTNGNMPVGLNLDFNEQTFNDLMWAARIQQVGSTPLTEDANGWPSSDFAWVLDNRYAFAWTPGATNIDPQKKSTDLSGTYTLTFTGQATLTVGGDDPAHAATTISNQSYDAGSNTTTATVTFGNPAGGLISVINFTNTQRNASDTPGNGLTNIHLWRPGYQSSTSPYYSDLWLQSITNYNWSAMRFMGALGTNSYAAYTSQEVYPYRLNWSTDRWMPNVGPLYGANHLGVHGNISWEDVIRVAQLTHKDIWINIPVNASTDYVQQLANLMKNGDQYTNNQGIPSDVNIYLEYSNEMWHDGFYQGPWNDTAAQDEVKSGNTNINYDGNTDVGTIKFRRIAEWTINFGNTFKQTFNDNGTRIRPVINNAAIGADPDMLKYVSTEYGPPSQYLYGIAQTGYYTSTDRSSVQSILNTLKTSSDSNVSGYVASRAIATYYGLHSLTYEAGEGDTSSLPNGGTESDQELYNQFAATRDPGMQDVEMHDLNNWYSSGGELYMQFSHVGRYSVYGFWGLSDDLTIQNSGKWNGYIQAMGTARPAVTAGQTVSGSGATTLSVTKDVFGTDFGRPGSNSQVYFLLNVAQSGTYDLSITTNGSGPDNGGIGQAQTFINNSAIGGVTNMPASSTIDFGPVQLQAGLNTLSILSVHGSFDPAYPNDVFHDQWQPVNAILTPTSTGIANGHYVLTNQNSGLVLDNSFGGGVGNHEQQWGSNGTANQHWSIQSVGNGYYTITCDNNNLALDVDGQSTNQGAAIVLQTPNGGDSQLWQISSIGGGDYTITNKHSGDVLDVNGAATNAGAPVIQWPYHNGTNQQWQLQTVS